MLTSIGAAAFGTYEAGAALDPVSLEIALPAGCDVVVASPQAGAELAWLWWLIGAVVLGAIVMAVVVTAVRRRSA